MTAPVIQLRNGRVSDAARMVQLFTDDRVRRHLGGPKRKTIAWLLALASLVGGAVRAPPLGADQLRCTHRTDARHHGGGWQLGSRLDDKAQARWFADHGYLVVSVDYSLSDAEHHNWDLQESQIACALAWVNENAARYGGDSTRLGLTGSSAGGNLASNVASKIASGHLRSSCGGTVPTVRAVASLYGATDLVSIYHHSDPQVRNGLQEMAVHYTGGTPTQYPERYASVATLNSATSKTPPTLWVYGDSDALVPPSSMDAMVEVLQERGVDSHGIRIPQANHGLDFRNSIQQQIWRQAALDWLRGHQVA